jgi:hypothetical protein
MISREKLALVHLAAQRLSISDDDRRSLMKAEAGVTSSKDLDEPGFKRVMDRYAKMGFESDARSEKKARRQKKPANVVGLATSRQKWKIEQNYQALGFDSIARRQGFNRKQCGKLDTRQMTVGDAIKVIEGQEAMLERVRRGESSASSCVESD